MRSFLLLVLSLSGLVIVSCSWPQSKTQPEAQRPVGAPSSGVNSSSTPDADISPIPDTANTSSPDVSSPDVGIVPAPTADTSPIPEVANLPNRTPAPYSQVDAAQGNIFSILADQKAAWLLNGGQFTADFNALPSKPTSETKLYRFAIAQADQRVAIVTATAQQENLPSYAGAVFAIEASLPVVGLCQSNQPSQSPPTFPKRVGDKVECASGSSLVDQR